MYLSDLALNDFRSYREVVLSFSPGVTTFIGENGQGKTNLVEAIGYLATFSSHRVSADAALVRQGANAGVIRAKVFHGESPTTLDIEILAGRANRARLNRGNVRPAELLGIVRAVVFAPEDLSLVKGDPGERRRFLDDVMVQFRPRMGGVKSDYDKVLRQRAALLKTMQKARRRGGFVDETTLGIFDAQLARHGARIIAQRAAIISQLRPHVEHYYREVSGGKGNARIDYLCNVDQRLNWSVPDIALIAGDDTGEIVRQIDSHEAELMDVELSERRMLEALAAHRDDEINRGVNLVGPHRDDMILSLGTLPAKGYASHGESWSYALSLRLGSWQLMREDESGDWANDGEPILILDDVFAELDARRRTRLAGIVAEAEQVFVTAAVGDDLPLELTGTRFLVHNGTVERMDESDE
ncbi:MAG: DNA replication/repair protein RecF [Actinomycetaceae bacterium]|nr:DNA replication/repair protein RecF [Actinomycetaceae bacterium]